MFTTAGQRQACENKEIIRIKKNLCTVANYGKKFSKPHIVKPYLLHYQNHHANISCNKYNHHGL